MPNEELGNDEKSQVVSEELQRINALNFLQSQIAKYYGNDGILSSKEKTELDKLSETLGVTREHYERLIGIAKDEICNFKKFDVVSFLLDREDKLKLYSDAERLSIRISRVERWISELKGIITPKDEEKVNKREIMIGKMKKIMKWFDQELYVETNADIVYNKETPKGIAKSAQDDGISKQFVDEIDDGKYILIADEIDDFMNDEKNLAWRSYCKQLLLKNIRGKSSVELNGKLKEVFDGIDDGEKNKFNDENQYEMLNKTLDAPAKKSDKKLKDIFDDAVEEYAKEEYSFEEKIKRCEKNKLAENASKETIEENQKRIDEIRETLKELDVIKIRIRQYSDIKKLFDKNGYKESKTEVDFQTHPAALFFYIIVVLLCFSVVGGVLFRNLDMIHKYIEGEKNLSLEGIRFTTVEINGVQWMVENLNHELDSCRSCKLSKLAKNGGLFYSLDEAVKACPSGWRLPSLSEWQNLIDYFENDSLAAYNLKSRSLWDDGMKGSDSVGFSALPAGLYNVSSHSLRETNGASWWTHTMKNEKEAYVVKIGSNARARIVPENIGQDYHSVRCVKIEANKVPCAPNIAKWSDSEISKTLKNGNVVGLIDGSNLPIVQFPRGRPEAIYDSIRFVKIAKTEDSSKGPNFPERVFPEQANVDLTRYYETVYYWNGEAWKDSTVWREDSAKISGDYKILDLDTRDSLCWIGFNPLGTDSATAYVPVLNPCDSLRKGDEYRIEAYYNIFARRLVDRKCAENETLSYRFVKAAVHAR